MTESNQRSEPGWAAKFEDRMNMFIGFLCGVAITHETIDLEALSQAQQLGAKAIAGVAGVGVVTLVPKAIGNLIDRHKANSGQQG